MISLKTVQLPSFASFALLGAVALAVSGCSEEKKAETKEIIRPVKVVEIAEARDTRALDYSGAVKARVEMNLGFRVAGKITDRRVNIGDRVKPGDLLGKFRRDNTIRFVPQQGC